MCAITSICCSQSRRLSGINLPVAFSIHSQSPDLKVTFCVQSKGHLHAELATRSLTVSNVAVYDQLPGDPLELLTFRTDVRGKCSWSSWARCRCRSCEE